MKRRNLLQTAAAILGTTTTAAAIAAKAEKKPAPEIIKARKKALPKTNKSPTIAICGGGWGGLTAARHLAEKLPKANIILIEKNPTFWSGPMSNKWLIDVVSTDFVNRDMLSAANKFGYTLLHSEVIDFDRENRQIQTAAGWVDYDYLILSGGIRDAFDQWFGDDQQTINYTKTHFSSAYIPNHEMFHLKNRVRNFKGGTLVMTLPPPPHRCPPSPYERACLMAWQFKKDKIPAKIIILDPKPMLAPISAGYRAAFEELYSDIITHIPNAGVKEVDPYNKKINTQAGEFKFDEAIFMPPHQAADMVGKAGLIGKDAQGKPTGWADMDARYFTANQDDKVYFVGDVMGFISPQFGHYPKSAHVANAIGKIVATNLAQRIKGEEVKAILPNNLCYMLVNNSPKEAVSVLFDYELNQAGQVIQTQTDIDMRSGELVKEDFEWIADKFNDFLGVEKNETLKHMPKIEE